jgi:predicted negative regulator of RcsB-dependent stress response
MAYDLEEQEQLETFKAWWKQYGNYASSALLAVVVGILGYQAWNYYQHQQSAKASERFEQLTRLGYEDEKDLKQIKALSADLMENFSSTAYAGRAAVAVAKANLKANDAKSAEAQLNWAVDHAKEPAIRSIAILQLAGLQLNRKDYNAALKTLDQSHDEGFEGLFSDMRGDVFLAQGKRAEAKKAFEAALEKLDASGRYYRYTAYKLESLGS